MPPQSEDVEARMATTPGRVGGSEYAATKAEDAELDQMVRAASVPNLAALMASAVKKGLITPTTGYGNA
jgi:antibiotic biosynthesis monooxygenase (ABM) superfamily enzyme